MDTPAPGPGRRWYTAVWQARSGVRIRLHRTEVAEADTDVSEQEAERIFRVMAEPIKTKIAALEAGFKEFDR